MVSASDVGKLLLLACTRPGEARSLITYKVSRGARDENRDSRADVSPGSPGSDLA